MAPPWTNKFVDDDATNQKGKVTAPRVLQECAVGIHTPLGGIDFPRARAQ